MSSNLPSKSYPYDDFEDQLFDSICNDVFNASKEDLAEMCEDHGIRIEKDEDLELLVMAIYAANQEGAYND